MKSNLTTASEAMSQGAEKFYFFFQTMTIKNIRNFIKQHKQLLQYRGVYKEHYKFSYRDYNILDVAGFLHRLICGVVGQHNTNMPITSADVLLHRVS